MFTDAKMRSALALQAGLSHTDVDSERRLGNRLLLIALVAHAVRSMMSRQPLIAICGFERKCTTYGRHKNKLRKSASQNITMKYSMDHFNGKNENAVNSTSLKW